MSVSVIVTSGQLADPLPEEPLSDELPDELPEELDDPDDDPEELDEDPEDDQHARHRIQGYIQRWWSNGGVRANSLITKVL